MIRSTNCDECGITWSYESKRRTRIPAMCPHCRDLPDVLRRRKLDQQVARRKRGELRAAALDERLKRGKGG